MHRKFRSISHGAGLAILLSMGSMPANAIVSQQVSTSFIDINAFETRDIERIDDSAGPITDTILASISGGFGDSFATVGPFGSLGMQGELFRTGEFDAQIVIRNDRIINNSGRSQNARANFIIDGGAFTMFAGVGSNMRFLMTIEADILGDGNFPTRFQTGFELEQLVESNVSAQFFGTDIGATFNQQTSTIDVPVFFGGFEIGDILPNSVIDISYQIDFGGTLVNFTEFTRWQFSDPFNVDGFGEAPTVTFSDIDSTVPEPSSALLLLAGVGLLARFRRKSVLTS